MTEAASLPSFQTFRDPAGSVEVRADAVYRRIFPPHDAEMLEFLRTPLAARLVAQGRLVASEVVTPSSGEEPLLLRHPLISFQSYPWEWPPTLWLAAAELTLTLCSELVEAGWVLQDATPLNILFRGAKPVLVDVLSIRRADPHQALWYPYGQFVRTFLLPMLAYKSLGWPLHAMLLRRDGYEPEELFAALPWHQRLLQPARSAVTLPVLLSGKTARRGVAHHPRPMKDAEMAKYVLLKTLSRLRKHMRSATPGHRASTWSDYAATASHYDAADHEQKREFVARMLAEIAPARVLDVGCNTGVYSMLAADAGVEVVSIDTDLQAVDILAARLQQSPKNIQPLCVDLSHPTPSSGWENRESRSFLDRCSGHFDLVMMLAVIHHLLLRSQVPLGNIAALCSRLTTRHLIVEWVPPEDEKYQELVRGRDGLYAHITEAAFREAFARYFTVLAERKLANNRLLICFRKD